MTKKIVSVVVVLVVALAAFLGFTFYNAYQAKPEQVTKNFVNALVSSDAEGSRKYFTEELAKQYGNTWEDYVRSYRDAKGQPEFVKQEQIQDTFNTYPEDSDPRRFIYKIKLKDATYQLTLVGYKENGTWKIDGLQGSYL